MTTLEQTAAPKPTRIAPIVTPDAKFFWDAADQEQFVGQKCGDCGQFAFPPRPMCPHCHSLKRQVVKLSGHGKVISWTMPRHPPPFGFREPPIIAVIELDEGIRFVSNVVGATLEQMKPDLPVEVLFEPTMNNHKVPVFKLRSPHPRLDKLGNDPMSFPSSQTPRPRAGEGVTPVSPPPRAGEGQGGGRS